MKIKTSGLSGVALDWAVSEAVGVAVFRRSGGMISDGEIALMDVQANKAWSPSINWSQGGPLIESNQVFLDPPHDMHRANYDEKTGKVKGCWETYESWHATVSSRVRTLPPKIEGFPGRVGRGEGETALIAACRAIVTSVFGDEIEIPQELAP